MMKATKTMRFFQKSSSDSGCLVAFGTYLQGPLEYIPQISLVSRRHTTIQVIFICVV